MISAENRESHLVRNFIFQKNVMSLPRCKSSGHVNRFVQRPSELFDFFFDLPPLVDLDVPPPTLDTDDDVDCVARTAAAVVVVSSCSEARRFFRWEWPPESSAALTKSSLLALDICSCGWSGLATDCCCCCCCCSSRRPPCRDC